jgi:hypothetical protein
LYLCKSPLALVMTAVPGKDLNAYAAAGEDLTPEVLDGAERSLAAAMEQSWSRGQIHGDLAPRNLLCDVEAKALSLVDPGTLESCRVCSEIARGWPPAVLDLAHMLSVLGTDVADAIGNPAGRLRRQIFTESALRACIEMIGPRDEKQRLLEEIRGCAEAHLDEMLALSWSFRGLWRWLVGQIAVRRINATLDLLKAELDTSTSSGEASTYGFASRTQWAKG